VSDNEIPKGLVPKLLVVMSGVVTYVFLLAHALRQEFSYLTVVLLALTPFLALSTIGLIVVLQIRKEEKNE